MNELQRRRTLAGMTKAELVQLVITMEAGINELRARVENAYGDEP